MDFYVICGTCISYDSQVDSCFRRNEVAGIKLFLAKCKCTAVYCIIKNSFKSMDALDIDVQFNLMNNVSIYKTIQKLLLCVLVC